MKFDFYDRKAVYGRIVFALCLEKTKMKERVIIGEEIEVRLRLEKGSGDVYLDETHPLGNMLFTFESDAERKWNMSISQLAESYDKVGLRDSKRWQAAEEPTAFLRSKYENGVPVAKYAAMRVWIKYLNYFNKSRAKVGFIASSSMLCRPFHLYAQYKPWYDDVHNLLDNTLYSNESRLDLWYPNPRRSTECVVAYDSFQPILFYYLKRLEEWNLYFQQCKICDKYFLARSRRYEMCSVKCRAKQAAENKRQFDERAKDSAYEKLYGNTYDYWYNRIRKLKKKQAPESVISEAESAFALFRSEGVRLKGTVKFSEYNAWIGEQMVIIDRIMQKMG